MSAVAVLTKELLNKWYGYINTQNFEKATATKADVEKNLETIDDDQPLWAHYLVTKFGYFLLTESYDKAQDVLNQIGEMDYDVDVELRYRFYLFKGVHSMICDSKFEEALSCFNIAKKLLDYITVHTEKAEYDYKVSVLYYHLSEPLLAAQHINKALEVYEKIPEYGKKCASCKNLLGLSCIELKQYAQAEEHFHSALDYATKNEVLFLRSQILHNLGLMYSEQNLAKAAINWLKESLSNTHLHYLTAYLLSRECFKIGDMEEGKDWLSKGKKICEIYDNKEYLTRFNLLEAFYFSPDNTFIEQYKEGISYFSTEKIWEYVEEYAEQLANHFNKNALYQDSAEFYSLASNARKNIIKLEGLN